MLRGLCLIGLLIVLGLHLGQSDVMGLVTVVAGDEAVLPVLDRAPISPVIQEVPIEETYRRQCAACHGQRGRGDGRMARRFKPPPADFQDPEGVAKRTDEELIQVITEGRASMPAFEDVLSEDVVVALVTYVRDLSRGTAP